MATIDTIADRSTGTAVAGKMYFETSTNQLVVYNGSAWIELDSDGTGAVQFENRWGASFDGTNDYIDCGTITGLQGSSNGAISVWIKPDTAGDAPNIGYRPSSDHQFVLTFVGGTLYFGVRNGSTGNIYTTTAIPNDANWHNYVATFNSGTTKIYIDGSEVSGTQTGTNPSTISSTLGSFFIGRNGADNKYTDGLLDEASVFNTALSASDITSIYNNGVPGDISSLNPLGWWRMGDDSNDSASAGGSIATITDSSGNGNDATQSTASNQPTFKALEQAPTSVSFDGSNDYLDANDKFDFIQTTGNFTISTWLKLTNYTSTSNIQSILGTTYTSGQKGFYLFYDNRTSYNKTLRVSFPAGTTESINVDNGITDNNWHNIVVTGSTGGSLTLYKDGLQIGTTSAPSTTTTTALYTMKLGAVIINGAPTNILNGNMDEVAVFNTALLASDVASLAASRGAHIKDDLGLTPVAYYRMGEDDSLTNGASASQISDISGNGNHATQSTAANQPTASVDPVIYV